MVQDQRSKQFESEANTSRHLLAVSGEKAKTASSRLRLKPSTKTRRVIRLPPAQGNAAQAMLGEQEARVLEFKPFLLHSVTYYDVTVAYRDRSVGHAPAGSGGRPENLHPARWSLP